ncbi:GyrI-like domain-containing protein [Acutalibacter caecimuris]|uniref:GyrI-like domain-containing protein n=1 Tax=Acutalibacter caecimuris TaxID=3093657 RepID=UPI002AC9032A|nr:GyrI-like domain-containing protein [Acutalibacter sp. M00118]
MAFDYKKEYKAFYQPTTKPNLIEVPSMNFVAVRGSGNPNQEDGEYKTAISILYGVAFTIKMSKKGDHRIEGYFDYVVPPLEGLWWQNDGKSIDFSHKDSFQWISMIRLPDFVTPEEFAWAVGEATAKKGTDYSKAEFLTYQEGLCVQCMHIGPYDAETATLEKILAFARDNDCLPDHSETRRHHEIYLGDPRKCAPQRLRTVIRIPVRRT